MQSIHIIGNLGRDPEVKFTANGKATCKFSVAVSEKWTANGEQQEHTEWFTVIAWDKLAENCGKYLAKGRQVFVGGRLRTRSYDDKDGNKKSITELVARDVQFLGSPSGTRQDKDPAEDGEIPF